MARRFLLALVTLLACPLPPAHASTEEFSTLDVVRLEDDDESAIDHAETRFPIEWRDEWERAPQGFRSSQGCLTAAQWFMDNQLRAGSPIGRRARFEVRLDQWNSDLASWNNLELWARFPQRFGTLGVMFRPYADKSRHDMALAWGVGADSTAFQLDVVWGFEDLFNNLWAFRQTQVGGRGEPYRRHPWEPALQLAIRHSGWRAELSGKYLTPSEQRLVPTAADSSALATLWGTRVRARVEVVLGRRATWILEGENWQATGTRGFAGGAPASATRDFQRLWSAGTGVRAAIAPRLEAEAQVSQLGRDAAFGRRADPTRFGALDRVLQAELRWAVRPSFTARFGALYDRVTVGWQGPEWIQTYGTRNESRAYFGFLAQVGRVRFTAVEGIELDPEPYEVNFHHDKAFGQLQTTF